MLLGSSPETQYDLRFRLFGIPIRVHPLFWLVMVLLSGQPDSLLGAGIFVLCALFSVLAHELGHGLTARLLGYPPRGIVLYAMGGYCEFQGERQEPWRRLLILLAGPGAGFLILLVAILLTTDLIIPPESFSQSEAYQDAIHDLIFINLFWGVLNLLPIWPLDGGQVCGVVLGMLNPSQGERWAHVISLLFAGSIAALAATWEQLMPAVWFGYFGYINYRILQSYHDAYSSSWN